MFKVGDYVFSNSDRYAYTKKGYILKIKEFSSYDRSECLVDINVVLNNRLVVSTGNLKIEARDLVPINKQTIEVFKDFIISRNNEETYRFLLKMVGKTNKELRQEFIDKAPRCLCCGKKLTFKQFLNSQYLCDKHFTNKDSVSGYHTGKCNGFKMLSLDGEDLQGIQYYGFELEVNISCGDNMYNNFCSYKNNYVAYIKELMGDIVNSVERDGSVDNGFEIVSNAMTMAYFKSNQTQRKLKLLMDFLNRVKLNYGGGCGFHIHTTRTTKLQDNYNIAKLNVLVETFREELKKLSNRVNFSYCNFINVPYNTTDYMLKRQDEDRYLVINNQNSETVELRLFKSSTDLTTINAYLSIYEKMIDYAKSDKFNITLKQFLGTKQLKEYATSKGIDFSVNKKVVDISSKVEELERKRKERINVLREKIKKAIKKEISALTRVILNLTGDYSISKVENMITKVARYNELYKCLYNNRDTDIFTSSYYSDGINEMVREFKELVNKGGR